MKRRVVITLVAALPVTALIWWVAENTYWTEVTIPAPLKGEARTNPYYGAQRLAEALGARTTRTRTFAPPAGEAVVVLSDWHWSLSPGRRESVERWVESGGRLLVEGDLAGGEREFAAWSGITREYRELEDFEFEEPCRSLEEYAAQAAATPSRSGTRVLCHVNLGSSLTTSKSPTWTLRDASGVHAMRVPVGKGSVTVINGEAFRYIDFLIGDHAALFVDATELRRRDVVHFVSEEQHPSLLTLVWRHGAPVLILALGVLVLQLWRTAARFGPLAAAPPHARRSLAEQIRGTGAFAWRHGGGDELHAATVRALDEAAQRRIPRYARLSAKERAAALERLTGFDPIALLAAIHDPRARRPQELRSTLALLEETRRRTLFTKHTYAHG